MSTPDFLKPRDYQFYCPTPQPPEGFPPRDTPEALLRAANKAHDNIQLLVRENDLLRAALLDLRTKQRRQLKLFLFLMGLTWTVLGWALNLLIPYAVHGMAK